MRSRQPARREQGRPAPRAGHGNIPTCLASFSMFFGVMLLPMPLQRIEPKEPGTEAFQILILQPKFVYRMGNDPVSRVHRDERNEADQRPRKSSALGGRHQQHREKRDYAQSLAEPAECKNRDSRSSTRHIRFSCPAGACREAPAHAPKRGTWRWTPKRC